MTSTTIVRALYFSSGGVHCNRASAETKFRPNSDCCCYCLMMWMMWDDVWLCSLVICHITSYQFEWVTTLSSQWLCFFMVEMGIIKHFVFLLICVLPVFLLWLKLANFSQREIDIPVSIAWRLVVKNICPAWGQSGQDIKHSDSAVPKVDFVSDTWVRKLLVHSSFWWSISDC